MIHVHLCTDLYLGELFCTSVFPLCEAVLELYAIFLQQGELQLENARRDLQQKWELVRKGLAVLNTVTGQQPMPDNGEHHSSLMDTVGKLYNIIHLVLGIMLPV